MKEEIARDRAEREARAKEKASGASTTTQPIVPAPQKDYDTCRLQVKRVAVLATKFVEMVVTPTGIVLCAGTRM